MTNEISEIIEQAIKLHKKGQLGAAEDIYHQILKAEPRHANTLNLLGLVYSAKGDHQKAANLIGKAIIEEPKEADFHSNFALVKLALGHPIDAMRHCSRAIKLNSNFGEAHYNLGNALFSLGKTDEAQISFKRATEIDPQNDQFWSNYLFCLNFAPSTNQKIVALENKRWAKTISFKHKNEPQFKYDCSTTKRLRLAYYLPEWDLHVTARFLDATLPHHNRKQFEIFLYGFASSSNGCPSLLEPHIDNWIDTSDLELSSIANRMRYDQIDILVHPCTFKARYRKILAYKTSPIQIASVNLVSTTGIKNSTHLVTDNFLSPPSETESYFSENLIRLSGFNVYKPPKNSPAIGPLPAAKSGHFMFGSFNNPAKLNSNCINLWAECLRNIPTAQLLLKHRAFESQEICEQFSKSFEMQKVNKDRIIFSGYTKSNRSYLDSYNKVDLSLDPIPFGGGTTTYDSIWMGVPVLTMVGDSIMGRLTGSVMSRLKLFQFIAYSREEYISKAKLLVENPSELKKIRKKLRISSRNTVFNAELHIREFETACRKIWTSYCQNRTSSLG